MTRGEENSRNPRENLPEAQAGGSSTSVTPSLLYRLVEADGESGRSVGPDKGAGFGFIDRFSQGIETKSKIHNDALRTPGLGKT